VPSELSTAPELLREQVVALVTQPLEAQSTVLRLGPRMFTSSGGSPIRVPKFIDFDVLQRASMTGNGAASATYEVWHGENELITEDEPTFAELVLLPRTMRSIKVIHRISNELARLAVVDVVNAIRDALVRRIALALDVQLIKGDGTSDTPVGLLHMSGRQTHSASLTIDHALDVVGMALGVDASPTRWLMNPARFIQLRQLKDLQDRPLLQPDPQQGNPC
jgi:HK97 family phage major capsid protein